jgi:hypothetical protein
MSVKFSVYAAGLTNLPLPAVSTDIAVVSRAGVDYQTPAGNADTLSLPISITNAGVPIIAVSWGQEDAIVLAGQDSGVTTSLHVGPAVAISADTISELVTYRTIASSQAFGGNYGRWSYSNLGSNNGNQSGIIGEFGGTAPLGPYLIQVGIENPPGVFTAFEGWRFQTAPGGSESNPQGAVLFGTTATVPRNQITMVIQSIGSAGTRDSHAVLWEGKANDGTERAVWWRARAHPTTNAGASSFIIQQNLNGGGWNTPLSIGSDGSGVLSGVFTATGGHAPAGGFAAFPRTIHTGGVGGTLATSAFSAQTPVITEVYVAEVFIPANVTISGVALLNSGTISGNVKVGLFDSSGNLLATSASTAQSGTSQFQRVAFTGGYGAVGPASYYVGVFFDNNTTRPWAHTVGNFGAGKLTGQTYATGFVSNALLAPSTFTTALGPVATLY